MNKLELVRGSEGYSLYLNDKRIAGNKPMAVGTSVSNWNLSNLKLEELLSEDHTNIEYVSDKEPGFKNYVLIECTPLYEFNGMVFINGHIITNSKVNKTEFAAYLNEVKECRKYRYMSKLVYNKRIKCKVISEEALNKWKRFWVRKDEFIKNFK